MFPRPPFEGNDSSHLRATTGGLNGFSLAAKGLPPPRYASGGRYSIATVAEEISVRWVYGVKPLNLKTFGRVTGYMQIIVRDNNVEQALRALKKKLQREGVYREMKLRRHYEKPSEKRARERAAAIRRARKLERKRAEREGAR